MVKIGDVIHGYEIVGISNQKYMDGHKLFHVRCVKCGFEKKDVLMSSIKERLTERCCHVKTHVNWYSPRLRKIFKSMITRCYDHKHHSYLGYGGKNIKICEEWLKDPQVFNDWAVQNGYTNLLTIDRIDPTKGYSSDNCRQITPLENFKWKITTRHITVNGITDSGRGWAERIGVGINSINRRIREKGLEATIEFIKSRIH